MVGLRLRTGIAGCLLVAAGAGAWAQEATGQAAGQAAGQPPAACSGLMCLFKPHADEGRPAPAAAPQADARPAEASPAEPVKAAAPAAPPVRRLPVLTIAADPADLPRLKALAAFSAHNALRFVRPDDEEADLAVAPALDPAGDRSLRLYAEELHVVAGPAVHSLADLRDKVVSFGPADGATRAIARKAFAALAIPVKEAALDDDNAFDGLATGDVDAVVVLAPRPSARLQRLRAPGLHLIAWPEGAALPAGASLATVPGGSYPRLAGAGEAVRVLAVDAVLTARGKNGRLAAARGLLAALGSRSAALARHGFDRIGADLDTRRGRRVASDERR